MIGNISYQLWLSTVAMETNTYKNQIIITSNNIIDSSMCTYNYFMTYMTWKRNYNISGKNVI